MESIKNRVRRGRPTDLNKRAAILEAARKLFFRGGPLSVTMEAVADKAGVSKVTVYGHFPHRDDLMRAVIVASQERLVAALRNPVEDIGGLERSLNTFGLDLLNFFCSDDYQLLDRMLATQVCVDPKLGHLIYEHGPLAVLQQLAGLLERLNAQGLVRIDDTFVAAEQLLGMWRGILVEGLRMQRCKIPDKPELQARVQKAIDTFIRAYGTAKSRRDVARD